MRNDKITATVASIVLFLFVGTINATTELMDRARQGLTIQTWAPFCWEYTSAASTLLLIPLILLLDGRLPFRNGRWRAPLLMHLGLTVPFSLAHVAMMVALRKLIYALAGSHYDFGNVAVELLYEFRKDFVTYFVILAAIYGWRMLRASRAGATYGDSADTAAPTFLVRSRGKAHSIPAREIDWLEAAGNYVLLHVGRATHPLRDTMKGIEDRLGDAFCRIHRSTIVNLGRIERTLPAPGGDQLVRLRDGTELKVSRLLKANLAAALDAGRPRG